MPKPIKCENCFNWNRDHRWGEKKDKAACKYNAPTIGRDGMACDTSGRWPSTHADDWCSRFAQADE